jgi:hypothetical protein
MSMQRSISLLALAVIVLLFVASCSPFIIRDPYSLPPDAHDMDKTVNMKGIPLLVSEHSINVGGRTTSTITLMYKDETFSFRSNADRSLTLLQSSFSNPAYGAMPQSPLPVWFKIKYPHLNYSKE